MSDNRGGKVVIWGAGAHAQVVADAVMLEGRYQICGFLDDLHADRRGSEFFGATVLGGQEQLDGLLERGVTNLIFGFGDCAARLRLATMLTKRGCQFGTVVHPSATVAGDVTIGPGTVILAGAVISTGAKIGSNVIVNTSASIDHHSQVADGAHIAPGCRIAGHVEIGRGTWLGIGSTVIDGARIGHSTVIGAGAVVLKDIPDGVVAYGVPARVMRNSSDYEAIP